MREVIRLFTPPEWPTWHPLARLGAVVIYVVLMAPVMWLAPKIGAWVVKLTFG